MAKDNSGWVKLHRKIWESEIWKSKEPFDERSAWVDMILMANHKATVTTIGGKKVELKPGQFHTSYKNLAARWRWSVNKVRRYMRRAIRRGDVIANGTPSGTTITLENYASYQNKRRTNGTTNGITNGITNGTQTRSKERKDIKSAPEKRKSASGAQRKKDPPMGDPIL